MENGPSLGVRLLLLVLAALMLGGCTNPGGAPGDTASTILSPPESEREASTSAPVLKVPISLNVSVVDRWVRPSDTISAEALAPVGVTVSWFLAPRNPYVPGDDDNLDLVPRSLGVVQPRGVSADIVMNGAGRFSYALASDLSVRVNVTVVPGLPGGSAAPVALVKDSWGLRFDPSEAYAAPGGVVTVHNQADQTAEFVRTDQMVAAAPAGSRASVAPPLLLGDYDVVAIARDSGDGWGEASARVIVDARKPDANVTLGPYSGTFQTTLNATIPRDENAYTFRFSLETAWLNWTTSTTAPTSASIRVSLADANGTILRHAEGALGSLAINGAPRNGLIIVEGLSGVQVSYRVVGEGRMALVTPASLFNT